MFMRARLGLPMNTFYLLNTPKSTPLESLNPCTPKTSIYLNDLLAEKLNWFASQPDIHAFFYPHFFKAQKNADNYSILCL